MNAVDELNMLLGIGPPRVKLPLTLERSGYTAVKPIGKGGFGQAHLIFHKAQQKHYVAKHVNMSSMTQKQRAEAHNEIAMLQQLRHPNIVRYVEYVEEHPHLYIVMEYADGGDLFGHLKKVAAAGKLLTEAQAMALFTQTALAIKHMHDRRMLHRDIKAQNVFLTKSHVVKLGDFGISTVLNSTVAMAQTMCGTPCYFSPELCAGRPYNNKSDIWALGVLLFEICNAGELPFDGANVKALMDGIVKKTARRIPSVYGDDIAALVESMMAKDPKARPDINGVLRSRAVQRWCPTLVAELTQLVPDAFAATLLSPRRPEPSEAPMRRQADDRPPIPPPRAAAAAAAAVPAPPPRGQQRVVHASNPPQAQQPAVAAQQPPRPAPSSSYDDHRDLMLAEAPPALAPAKDGSVAPALAHHQHGGDTAAGTAYTPALLAAARQAARASEAPDANDMQMVGNAALMSPHHASDDADSAAAAVGNNGSGVEDLCMVVAHLQSTMCSVIDEVGAVEASPRGKNVADASAEMPEDDTTEYDDDDDTTASRRTSVRNVSVAGLGVSESGDFDDPLGTVVDRNAVATANVGARPATTDPTPLPVPTATGFARTHENQAVGGGGNGLRLTIKQKSVLRSFAARSGGAADAIRMSTLEMPPGPAGQQQPQPAAGASPPSSTHDASSSDAGSPGSGPDDMCIGGHCLCGATVYAAWLSMAVGTFTCNCMACRRFSGNASVEWIHFPEVSFDDLIQASPSAKSFVVVKDSIELFFCGECGSSLAMLHDNVDGCVVARATLSDQSERVFDEATRGVGGESS